eukprot:TRINITY_DN56655_c0_g1_i1.p1 TRINITY_DN56655_c0_g1~~TRINITY_DN56655_c0_g1_i1.p1  ORF type:complete len:637 (-),score=90.63 TRINITY_DN56655_c0_g1_i1:100-2010(-)
MLEHGINSLTLWSGGWPNPTAASGSARCNAATLLSTPAVNGFRVRGFDRRSAIAAASCVALAAGRRNATRTLPHSRLNEDELMRKVSDYLETIGGTTSIQALRTLFGKNALTDDFMARYFDVDNSKVRRPSVSLRKNAERIAYEENQAAERVFRYLHRGGGAADLHYVTGKYSITKQKLLNFADGSIFEAVGTELRLKGGALAVASAASQTGRVTPKIGHRSSPTALLTKAGFATDEVAARRLQRRIEGLLVTTGDGVLPKIAVYRALSLKPSHALKRWLPRAGLRIAANGDMWVDDHRLTYFRVRRALAAVVVVQEMGGQASLQHLLEQLYRPSEIMEIEAEELTAEGRAASFAAGLAPSPEVEAWRLEPPEPREVTIKVNPVAALPPPRETFILAEPDSSEQSLAIERPVLGSEEVKMEILLAEREVDPPLWLEAWVREYFVVENDQVFLPYIKPWTRPEPKDPDAAGPPPTVTEEEAILMNVEEEIRLRYGRGNTLVLANLFQGLKVKFLRRFFDVTATNEVIAKSAARQMRDAIAIASRIVMAQDDSVYTADQAFTEFGVSKRWLRTYFIVNHVTGALSLDTDPVTAWDAPLKEKAPNPYIYTRLIAPRGYVIKSKNGKFANSYPAAGILYG